MSPKILERNITLLKWRSFGPLLFAGAVFVAYEMHTIGLSLTQILTSEGIFALTTLLFEIPTGIFSDMVSRKKTLLMADFVLLLGTIAFAFATTFWHIIVVQILCGIGVATISGTDSALLYDSLKILKREDQHKKILGDIRSFALIALALGQIVGGLVAPTSLRLPIILCIPAALMSFIISLFLTEPPRTSSKNTSAWSHSKSALALIFSNRILLFLILATMFISLGQKISLQTFNPYMELIQTPIIYWGILLAFFNILGAIIAKKAHHIEEKLGERNSFILIFGLQILGFLFLAKVHMWLAFAWPIFHWISRPFSDIFLSDQINKRIESAKRATVLSISSFSARLLQTIALPFIGYAIDLWSLQTMYLLIALAIGVVGVISGIGMYAKKVL